MCFLTPMLHLLGKSLCFIHLILRGFTGVKCQDVLRCYGCVELIVSLDYHKILLLPSKTEDLQERKRN